jgi:hypothetical protein
MPTATVVLCNATPGASWPQSLLDATEALASRLLAAAEVGQGEGSACLWLGYADPLASLARLLKVEPGSDPLALLERWMQEAEGFLRLKREHPKQCRLVNLAVLGDAAAAQLLAEHGLEAPLEPLPAQPTAPPLDPRLLVVLHHQQAAAGLYADLEACADLFGRQPNFSLPLPSLRSVGFAAECLQSWQADQELLQELIELREQRRLSSQEHHLALAALQQQNEQAQVLITELRAERDHALHQRTNLESELGSLRATAEDQLESLRSGIRDDRAAAELTEMQLHHVHDALERLLAERDGQKHELTAEIQQQMAERDRLHEELASLQSEQQALRGEMLHFMLSSTASAQLERERIPRLTSLLRQALELG